MRGLRRDAAVARLRLGVAPQFPTHRRSRPADRSRDAPHPNPLQPQARDRHPLLELQLLVLSAPFHLGTSYEDEVLQFKFEAAKLFMNEAYVVDS